MTWNNLGSRRFRVPVTAASVSREIASQQAKAANYATLRSISFFFPSPQLHKANPAVETSAARWHHLLSEEIVCKVPQYWQHGFPAAAVKSCAILCRGLY